MTHDAVSHLNLAEIESRMMQIVIDLHDAARLCALTDAGVSAALRNIARDMSALVADLRRLLCSEVDSNWTELDSRPAPLGD